ncbi:helix-turn-helix domain-containing protein [Streptomyces scabiei]|uniref:helix-turn-helix domain-containing protein n=1 Tax=Streptomyces scabiei TaxID=1930 RepID=UPI001B33AFAD|nr:MULTISPECIES: helix-turn-helix domain-containing protein [Streptomyces]MBP5883164.1 helix-turn-helix domain-containing protein [Streptomyces sp. LBUM 1487]MDX2626804.1 helix-turn-helix domain-containing protein [Streptomyces scabiei]MDX3162741.1 helix-turn-helix domain-containing protein [Streptomyces scabiei]
MPNQNTNPVTDEEHAEIRRLHAQGVGRNEIARRIGRGPRTVSEYCKREGLSFDRTATAAATEAKKIDAKARRAALIDRAYTRAERIFDRLEADVVDGYKFTSTTVNGIETERLDHVPAPEERSLATAVGQYLTQAAKLEALDSDGGVEDAESMLGKLMVGLKAAYDRASEGVVGEEAEGESP